jgi:transposase
MPLAKAISTSAVLNADETGWRLNGITHWLWCFTTKELCYYLITKAGDPRGQANLGNPVSGDSHLRLLGRL